MLSVDGLHLAYGPQQVLRGVSLDLQAGERVAILGGNAAGKTSLLHALCGLARADAGHVLFQQREMLRVPAQQHAHMGVHFCAAERPLFADMSVLENLEMGAFRWGGQKADHWGAMLAQIIAVFPQLKTRLRQRAGSLSGGEQKMVAIGRALMSKPTLLLLDEPSLGLSTGGILLMSQALKHWNKQGLTLLFTEQNITFATNLAQRAYVLERGLMEPLEGDKHGK